jgi:hypothetical protein
MWRLVLVDADHADSARRQLKAGGAAHCAQADDDDVRSAITAHTGILPDEKVGRTGAC